MQLPTIPVNTLEITKDDLITRNLVIAVAVPVSVGILAILLGCLCIWLQTRPARKVAREVLSDKIAQKDEEAARPTETFERKPDLHITHKHENHQHVEKGRHPGTHTSD